MSDAQDVNVDAELDDDTVKRYPHIPHLSAETRSQAYKRYIEIWTQEMDPHQTSPYEVWDPNTYFKEVATAETLESVVKEAIATSDRVWGNPQRSKQ